MKPTDGHGPAWGKLACIVLVLVAAAAAWRYTPLSHLADTRIIGEWADAIRETPWVPFALVLAYTPAALLMFPRQLITLTAVVAFGPLMGLVYASVGILLAAVALFSAGHWISYDFTRRLAGHHLDTIRRAGRSRGVLTVFAANVAPVPPFAVKAMLAGVVRIPLKEYILGILLSMLPGALAVTAFGAEVARILEDPSSMSAWRLALPLLCFAAFLFVIRRWLIRRGSA